MCIKILVQVLNSKGYNEAGGLSYHFTAAGRIKIKTNYSFWHLKFFLFILAYISIFFLIWIWQVSGKNRITKWSQLQKFRWHWLIQLNRLQVNNYMSLVYCIVCLPTKVKSSLVLYISYPFYPSLFKHYHFSHKFFCQKKKKRKSKLSG